MDEFSDKSIDKTIINLSRNSPVALVVGAAGFIGSHLVERLLAHNIQVIGVDNFLTGKKENLEKAVREKNFHLVNLSAQNLDLDVPRVDYIYIVANDKWDMKALFKIILKFKAKVVLVTSIDLYDSKLTSKLNWYKNAEIDLAHFTKENNLNSRIVRLAEVYGPRMHFRNEDPVTRLIQAALSDELQKETISLNFSTRAIYVDDAVSLIIKSIMSGATALKIFDGCLPSPVKVSEIKQILMDPLWYENRHFHPTDLPPWPTPNLEKTIKHLSWHPKISIVQALKHTINYFRENETYIPEIKKEVGWGADDWESKARLWREQFLSPSDIKQKNKKEERELEVSSKSEEKEERFDVKEQRKVYEKEKSKSTKRAVFLKLVAFAIIFYALIFPVIDLGWGFFTFRHNLTEASEALSKGEFDKSISSVKKAKGGIDRAEEFIKSIEIVRKTGIFQKEFEAADIYVDVGKEIAISSEHTVLGTKALYDSLKIISGEHTLDLKESLGSAASELQAADLGFSKAAVRLKDPKLYSGFFIYLKPRVESLADRVLVYANLVKQARSATFLLPEIIALEGKKAYLILLQNNNELRPSGGFIGSVAQVDFEGGKLKKLEVLDVYAIDGQLELHVEPPKEIKEDLGQKDWFLRDSNFEGDFPTSARQAAWFYTKVTGVKLDGVIAINLSAMEKLLEVTGPLELSDYGETISSDNLFERSIANSEQGFFPGSQAKKNFITALSTQLLNKLFFLPNINWPAVINSLGHSFEEKHLLVYLADPKLFSYLASENFAGAMPRQGVFKDGEVDDFISLVEANLGANKSNYYLDRVVKIETGIGKEGEINHRLRINYTNRSPSEVWPAGIYKNRMRIYLPFGAKLAKALWGEKDITAAVNSFVDYGRTAYSMLLEVNPREQKMLIFDYELANKVSFKEGKAKYSLDIIKQAGTHKDPLEWHLIYPINFKIQSKNTKIAGPQEHVISTDLSSDRKFEVIFTK